jgi:hypothetical protein
MTVGPTQTLVIDPEKNSEEHASMLGCEGNPYRINRSALICDDEENFI